MPTVTANGVQTYYERHGDGPPVVLAHGGGWDVRSWAPQVESALTDDYELVVYDVRGHGRSEAPPVDDYSLNLLSDDLHALVEVLDLDQPTVGGLSLGGMLAHTYAAEYPDDLSALVAAEARVSGETTLVQRATLAAFKPVVSLFGLEAGYRLQSWIAELSGAGGDDDYIDELDMTDDEYLRDAASHLDADQYFQMLSGVLDFEASLEPIDVPTLVVTGEDPHDVIVDAREAMQDEIDDVRVREIPDAGHGANLENPPAFNAALRDFLDDVHGRRTEEPAA